MRVDHLWRACLVAMASVAAEPESPRLALLGEVYPRVFFFRQAEGIARRKLDFETWEASFGRLMGIMGKCLDEEIPELSSLNPDYFRRFKERRPEQAVLLHFNGNARDPRFETGTYFAGHWVYRPAVAVLSDVPAETGETDVRVADVTAFRVGTGRYRTSNDDVALIAIGPDGRHDWRRCEQTQLVSVNAQAGTIRLRRGCYGTAPLSFRANETRAAAHEIEGPWGRNSHLLWFYNYSTACPRDDEGRTCADRLIDDLARWFGPSGPLRNFDGLEFDVLFHVTRGDTDGDGQADDGVIGGVNAYGLGVLDFARRLRARMGENFLLMADGALGFGGARSQRAVTSFNGIESEGWPDLRDWEIEDWSGGLHRHQFWAAHGRAPVFSYINHKWEEPVPDTPGTTRHVEAPFSRHRLAFAAAHMVDAALCYSTTPPVPDDRSFPIWDEFVAGRENRLGWLGRPEGPPVRLAAQAPNIWPQVDWAGSVREPVRASLGNDGVWTFQCDAGSELVWALREMPASGPDLVIDLVLSGEPLDGYPEDMPRYIEAALWGGEADLCDRAPDRATMTLRGGEEQSLVAESGALVRYQRAHEQQGRTLPAVLAHPPYRAAKGAVHWYRDVDIPAAGAPELLFDVALSDRAPGRSDGVWIRVEAAERRGQDTGPWTELFSGVAKEPKWVSHRVPLAALAGRSVQLRFTSDCGPHDHAVTDLIAWGGVRLACADDGRTPAQRCGLWVGRRPFPCSIYFRRIASRRVTLSFRAEGTTAVRVHRLAARAAPDLMARVFERGIVLANPSLASATFDLKSLSPGRSYRRIPGTARQDPATNDGSPVGFSVTLGERDGLFLMRADP